jgi:hypothetical protein
MAAVEEAEFIDSRLPTRLSRLRRLGHD